MISSWWLVTFDGGLPFHFSICRLLLYASVFRRAYFGECMLMMSKHIQLIVNNAIVPKKCLFSVGKYTNIMLMTFYRLFTALLQVFSHAPKVCMTILKIYLKELKKNIQSKSSLDNQLPTYDRKSAISMQIKRIVIKH